GLRTRFTPPARVRLGGEGGGDPAARIFGAILGEIVRQQGGGAPRPAAAELFAAVAVSNAFVVDVEFAAFEAPAQGGGIDFGIYQGGRRETGYRLAYRPGSRPSLALLRVLPTGAATVASVGLATRLEDGYAHRLEWRRGRNGRMVVLLDDAVVIETVDRAIGARFDGFHLVNRGGDYGIRRIAVYGAGG
ncbi:MAG: hypothetical protein IH906_05675, partial [Proteobacteria bacterium]|nr:hypothetical protein [Pseudomonadota bacterium]